MKKFKVHVDVHHILDDVEASSAEEAKQKAWDDYIGRQADDSD